MPALIVGIVIALLVAGSPPADAVNSHFAGQRSKWGVWEHPTSATTDSTLFLPLVLRNYPALTVFGVEMGEISESEGLSKVVQAQSQWVRRAALPWPDVEPTEGARNWSAVAGLEQELQTAASNGLTVILVVRYTPAWAQQRAGYPCGAIKPEKLGAFASFMRDAVARYSVTPYRVKYWEIWNEPDVAPEVVAPDSPFGCWGDASDPYYGGGYYADMLKQVYPAVKAADPQAQVLVGGLLLDCDPRQPPPGKDCMPSKFLEGILRNGGGPFFDGVSFHAYDYYSSALGQYVNANWQSAWNTTGPAMVAKAGFVKSVLATYGVSGKFLMNTEAALLCDTCANDPVFETTKAYYVAQLYAAAITEGLRANIWYTVLGWPGRNSGLLDGSLNPRPAYSAYQFAASELRASTFDEAVTGYAGVAGYKLQRGDRRIWVVWSLDGASHAITLPGTPLAAWDALGNPESVSSMLTVTTEPMYLEWSP